MRALAMVIALLAWGVAHAEGPRTTAFGFDHIVHDRNLIVAGGEALACARCHVEQKGKLAGKPGHAACFTQCHAPAPIAPKRGGKLAFGERAKICTSCHAESTQTAHYAGKPAVSYPPYTIDPDFNISFGHKQHAPVACTQCHDVRANAKRAPAHERCAGCHDGSKAAGKGPAMASCKTCHPQAVGKPSPPELAAVQNTVTSTFSHAKHAARGNAGKDCATCHAPIRATDDTQLPRPTAKTCAAGNCHDGKAAFATTVACTRCHEQPPRDRFDVARPTARFSHRGDHEQIVKTKPCAACHPIAKTGEVQVGGHAPCAECHADDFGAREPTICGACHNATEPWRKLVADRAPPDRTEFGATLDHGKHRGDCTSCHSLRTPTTELRTPRGHRACSGNGCHAVASGPAPRFESCAGCHRIGLAAEREQARIDAPWSVRTAFKHAIHANGPDGKPLACSACHTDLAGANVVELATPKKATCAACHDAGKPAFKLTGTTCGRCHRTETK